MPKRLTKPYHTPISLERFDEIVRLLDVTYGPRLLRASGDPVSELIGTILSQNTSDTNTARSFASLNDRFPTWDEVRDADVIEVRDAIRMGGLANIKAPRIQATLASLVEHNGSYDLAFLRDLPVHDAQTWLTDLNGIGPKTAACVLLFSLGMPTMPVDTHVGRVMTRLGVVPDKTSTITKQRMLEDLIGPDEDAIYAVHVETISHGRQICKALKPRCDACPLRELCDYARSRNHD